MKNIVKEIMILSIAIAVIFGLIAIDVFAACTAHTPVHGRVIHHTDPLGKCQDCADSTVEQGGCTGDLRTSNNTCIETNHDNVIYKRKCVNKVCVSSNTDIWGVDKPIPVEVVDGSNTSCPE